MIMAESCKKDNKTTATKTTIGQTRPKKSKQRKYPQRKSMDLTTSKVIQALIFPVLLENWYWKIRPITPRGHKKANFKTRNKEEIHSIYN